VTSLILSILLIGQVLPADSILDPGNFTNPDSIFVSDDFYASTSTNNDHLTLRIADPVDTTGTLDSVYVYLEQYVSASNGMWYILPMFNGMPGTATPSQNGTLSDSLLGFNVTTDISGWSDLYDLEIDLNVEKGGGATPDYFADYLYVYVFANGLGIEEGNQERKRGLNLSVPTLTQGQIEISYTLHAPASVNITVFNISGRRILERNTRGISGTNLVILDDVGDLNTGIYYICTKAIGTDGEVLTETAKFIKLD
jgi:hypothetical protein